MATLFTTILLAIGYAAIVRPMMVSYLISTSGNPIFSTSFVVFLISLQLVVGLVVGGMSSYWATRRHLTI